MIWIVSTTGDHVRSKTNNNAQNVTSVHNNTWNSDKLGTLSRPLNRP